MFKKILISLCMFKGCIDLLYWKAVWMFYVKLVCCCGVLQSEAQQLSHTDGEASSCAEEIHQIALWRHMIIRTNVLIYYRTECGQMTNTAVPSSLTLWRCEVRCGESPLITAPDSYDGDFWKRGFYICVYISDKQEVTGEEMLLRHDRCLFEEGLSGYVTFDVLHSDSLACVFALEHSWNIIMSVRLADPAALCHIKLKQEHLNTFSTTMFIWFACVYQYII